MKASSFLRRATLLLFAACGGLFAASAPVACGGNVSTTTTGATATATGAGGGATSASGTTTGSVVTGAGGAAGTGIGGSGAGGNGGWAKCAGPGECSTTYVGCCGPCGTAKIGDMVAVNRKAVDVYRAEACPMPPPCPRCAAFFDPNITARCVVNRCQLFDIRETPELSACLSDADCRLRKGSECCECGATGEWIAVSHAGAMGLPTLVCAPGSGCDLCDPVPPPGMKALCRAGRCEVDSGVKSP